MSIETAPTGDVYVIGSGGMTLQMLDTLDRLSAEGQRVVIADDRDVIPLGHHATATITAIPIGAEAVISIANSATRRLVSERRPDLSWGQLRAATALVSPMAKLGRGAVLAHGVIIEARAQIGRHFQANLYSYVAHECTIGDFVTLAPRVSCNGNVRIDDGVYVGTGVMIRQGLPSTPLLIGAGAFIGMGAIVTRDVLPGAKIGPGVVY